MVISNNGASGDYPGGTDVANQHAIQDGADVIDCTVQMSKDGIPFCLSSVNLLNTTLIGQTEFRSLLSTVTEIQTTPGIFSFSLNWTDIQGLTRKFGKLVLLVELKIMSFVAPSIEFRAHFIFLACSCDTESLLRL